MKTTYRILALLIIAALCFLAGSLMGHRMPGKGEVIIKTDTLTLRDTLHIPYPLLVDVTISEDDIKVPMEDIIIRNDSLAVLPMEVKSYEGEGYRAQISGYKPQLDWIETFTETKYITKTVTDNRKNMFYFSGEIMYHGNISASALLMYQRNWKHISLQTGTGYDFIGNQIIISAGIKIPVAKW